MQKPIHGHLLVGTDDTVYIPDVMNLSSDDLLRVYNASKRLLAKSHELERLLITGGTGEKLAEVEYELVMPIIGKRQFILNCTKPKEAPEVALVRRILTYLLYGSEELGIELSMRFDECERLAFDACKRLQALLA